MRQFRYPYQEVIPEIPAGKLTPGEDPLECGKRELQEETGAAAAQYEFLGKLYPSPGYCGEIIYMYMATGLTYGEMNPDEDEFLEVERIPLEKAAAMVLDGTITDAKKMCIRDRRRASHPRGDAHGYCHSPGRFTGWFPND